MPVRTAWISPAVKNTNPIILFMKIHEFFRASVVLLCMSIVVYDASAQDGRSQYPSSDASALIRSISSSVNHCSGAANILVPLGTFSDGGISVPVLVGYQTSGIKIADKSTSVGLGWRLSAGGKITRIVKGKPDETGYCNNWNFADERALMLHIFSQDRKYEYLRGLGFSKDDAEDRVPFVKYVPVDTEPDLFFFEIPGKSGMFVIDHDGTPHTVPYQNVKIAWIGKSYFTITDSDGSRYVFGKDDASRETTSATRYDVHIMGLNLSDTYTSTWHLNSITNYKGEQVVFDYQTLGAEYCEYSNTMYKFKYNASNGEEDVHNTATSKTSVGIWRPKVVSEIRGPRWKMIFHKTDNRISRVESLHAGQSMRSTCLDYRCENDRTLLTRIYSQAGDLQQTLCTFQYNTSVYFPSADTFDYDFWGYYNGKGNLTDRPKIKFATDSIPGADRSPSLEHTKAHILEAIKYPSGGETRYIYELNSAPASYLSAYFSYFNNKAGGLRVKEIRQADGAGNQSTTRYEYGEDGDGLCFTPTDHLYAGYVEPLDNSLYEVCFHSKPLVDMECMGGPVFYPSVTEIAPNGMRTTYTYTSTGEVRDTPSVVYYTPHNAILSMIQPAESPNDTYRKERFGFPDNSRFWRRGKLQHLTKSGRHYEELHKYSDFSGTKAVIKGYVPHYKDIPETVIIDSLLLCQYEWVSQPYFLESSMTRRDGGIGIPSMTTTVNYHYNTEYMVPDSVVAIDAAGNRIKTQIKYSFDVSTSGSYPGGSAGSAVSQMRSDNMVVPLEKATFRNGKLVGAELTEHKSLPRDIYNMQYVPVPAKQKVLAMDGPASTDHLYWSSVDVNGNMVCDSRYETVQEFDGYDERFNLTGSHSRNGNRREVIYGYGGSLPIAEIEYPDVKIVVDPQPGGDDGLPYARFYSGGVIRDVQLEPGISGYITVDVSHMVVLPDEWFDEEMFQFVTEIRSGRDVVASRTFDPRSWLTGWQVLLPGAGNYTLFVYNNSGIHPDADFSSWSLSVSIFYNSGAVLSPGDGLKAFHTSFEETADSRAITSEKARTGEKVWQGSYDADLSDRAAGDYVLSWWQSADGGETWVKVTHDLMTGTSGDSYSCGGPGLWIDEVRLVPKGARIKTYTYKIGAGKTSEMDHNGRTAYWEYDAFGRMLRTLDNDHNPVEKYEYHNNQF